MSAHDESTTDSLIEDAIEILIDRTLGSAGRPPRSSVTAWRTKARSNLHSLHDARAFELLSQDRCALTPKALADLLGSPPSASFRPGEPAPGSLYQRAEQQRRKRFDGQPAEKLDESTFRRCLAEARAARGEDR